MAGRHLREFKVPEWSDCAPVAAHPLAGPEDHAAIVCWEVQLRGPGGDAGYVVVSAGAGEPLIQCFATEGPTHTERLRRLAGPELATVRWHGPSHQTGHDDSGALLASLGRLPLVVHSHGDAAEASSRPRLGGTGGGSGVSSIGDYDHFFRGSAEGWDRQAFFDQIDPGTPPNSTGHQSGCGPTAWAALLAYHDLHWDPDLLYGTWDRRTEDDYVSRLIMTLHDRLGTSNLNGEGYTGLSAMKKGYSVMRDNLCHGRGYELEWYGWSTSPWAGIPSDEVVSFVFDAIYQDGLPCIVGYRSGTLSGHYALGFEIAIQRWYATVGLGGYSYYETAEPSSSEAGERGGYVRVNNLWGDAETDLKWIATQYVFGMWAIHPGTYACPQKRVLGHSGTDDMGHASVAGRFVVAWRGQGSGNINLLNSAAEGLAVPSSDGELDGVTAGERVVLTEFTPAGAVDACGWQLVKLRLPGCLLPLPGGLVRAGVSLARGVLPAELNVRGLEDVDELLFLAWRDSAGRIHIAFTDVRALSKRSFSEVVLPDRFRTRVDPTIAIAAEGEIEPLLYIAFGDSQGQLVAIQLDRFMKIAKDGWDRWPHTFGSDVQIEQQAVMGFGPFWRDRVIQFTSLWMPFTLTPLSGVRMSSNGKQVALAWVQPQNPWSSGGSIRFYKSFTFTGSWGDTALEFRGDWSISVTDTNNRPGLWMTDSGGCVLAWRAWDTNRIAVATVAGRVATLQAHLLDTASSGLSVHAVTDAKLNDVAVIAWFGTNAAQSMNHRLTYLTPPIVHADDLPK